MLPGRKSRPIRWRKPLKRSREDCPRAPILSERYGQGAVQELPSERSEGRINAMKTFIHLFYILYGSWLLANLIRLIVVTFDREWWNFKGVFVATAVFYVIGSAIYTIVCIQQKRLSVPDWIAKKMDMKDTDGKDE
jgi:hypothetical protein